MEIKKTANIIELNIEEENRSLILNCIVCLTVSRLKIELSCSDKDVELNAIYELYSEKKFITRDNRGKRHCEFNMGTVGKYFIRVSGNVDGKSFLFDTEKLNYSPFLATLNSMRTLIYDTPLTRFRHNSIKGLDFRKESSKIIDEISIVASSGFRLDDYFSDKGINKLSIYTEKSDYLIFKMCLSQLLFSNKVVIENHYNDTGKDYRISKQEDFNFQKFQRFYLKACDTNIPLLLAMKKIPKKLLNDLNKYKINFLSLPEILPDILCYVAFFKPLVLFSKKYPHLNIVLHNHPKIPNLDNASKYERKHIKGKTGELHNLLEGLKKSPPILRSESLEQFNYEIDEILPFLTEWDHLVMDNNGVVSGRDYSSKYVNFSAGHRITTDQPIQYERTVWHFGYSHVWGSGSPDHGTVASALQSSFNRAQQRVRVENYGYSGISRNVAAVMKKINSMEQYFNDGDIVLIETRDHFQNRAAQSNYHTLDISDLLLRPHSFGEVFVDTHHLNELGNKVIASKIFEFINNQGILETKPTNTLTINDDGKTEEQSSLCLPTSEQIALKNYLSDLEVMRPLIGAIVMNCNPFTLGHRYLIEQSAKKCSQLFIFVVEEDRSFFSFSDRIELVRKGTADILNVKVMPSGKFIISSTTFGDYFGKAEIQDQTVDPTMDLELFGKYIAPSLGINIRFAGEEPLDAITRQYNDAMQRILPKYGVQFEVIPRKESGGAVISASRVRDLLVSKDFQAIKELVPSTTFEWLSDKSS